MTATLQALTLTDLESLIDAEMARAMSKTGGNAAWIHATNPDGGGRYTLRHDFTNWYGQITYRGQDATNDDGLFVEVAAHEDVPGATVETRGFEVTLTGEMPLDVARASIRGILRWVRIQDRLAAGWAEWDQDIDMDGSEPDPERDDATEAAYAVDSEPTAGDRDAYGEDVPVDVDLEAERAAFLDDIAPA